MARCFVIQPFDKGGAFDKRYEDVLVPAIKQAELEPYRVDLDPSATVLIEDIENGISNSEICLADITLDNPNIWYEVGFALANQKPVVMICAEPRPTPPPFDVRHRQIIYYALHSPSDFKKLEAEISRRLVAQVEKTEALQTIASLSPVKETEGLSQYEIAALVTVMEHRLTPDSSVTPNEIENDMHRAGYNKLAVSLSLESLTRKRMVEHDRVHDDRDDYDYWIYRITPTGLAWILANQDRFLLRVKGIPQETDLTDKDIPF